MTFGTLKRPNAVEDIINTFKEAILHGDLKPGQRLPSEAELCEQLGVGRGTIREAMKMLRALGVVKIQQGDGTYIADKPTASALNPLVFALLLETGSGTDLLELRALLEIGGYQLAAQKAAAEDWPAILDAEAAFATYARLPEQDPDQLARFDLDFHLSILDATHNALIEKIGRTVEEMFFASIRSTLAKSSDLEQLIAEHHEIVQAVQQGQTDAIAHVVRQHLSHWGKEVGAIL